jgi:hypothetical protein
MFLYGYLGGTCSPGPRSWWKTSRPKPRSGGSGRAFGLWGRRRPGPKSFSPAFAHQEVTPAPAFHAASQAVRRELRDAYAWFVAAFRQAAAKLREGDRSAAFPVGSFPPALPFVGG